VIRIEFKLSFSLFPDELEFLDVKALYLKVVGKNAEVAQKLIQEDFHKRGKTQLWLFMCGEPNGLPNTISKGSGVYRSMVREAIGRRIELIEDSLDGGGLAIIRTQEDVFIVNITNLTGNTIKVVNPQELFVVSNYA